MKNHILIKALPLLILGLVFGACGGEGAENIGNVTEEPASTSDEKTEDPVTPAVTTISALVERPALSDIAQSSLVNDLPDNRITTRPCSDGECSLFTPRGDTGLKDKTNSAGELSIVVNDITQLNPVSGRADLILSCRCSGVPIQAFLQKELEGSEPQQIHFGTVNLETTLPLQAVGVSIPGFKGWGKEDYESRLSGGRVADLVTYQETFWENADPNKEGTHKTMATLKELLTVVVAGEKTFAEEDEFYQRLLKGDESQGLVIARAAQVMGQSEQKIWETYSESTSTLRQATETLKETFGYEATKGAIDTAEVATRVVARIYETRQKTPVTPKEEIQTPLVTTDLEPKKHAPEIVKKEPEPPTKPRPEEYKAPYKPQDKLQEKIERLPCENFVSSRTTCGIGACASTGMTSCFNDVIQNSCVPQAPGVEICDGRLDDNCDGTIDEGCSCTNGSTQSCYSGPSQTRGVGQCIAGTQTCTQGRWGACIGQIIPIPSDLSCNGIDNDCDGRKDEDYVRTVISCGVGACSNLGTTVCLNGAIQNNCTARPPGIEVCDGSIDEDCDGSTDEGCRCINGTSQACYSGPSGTSGIGQCVAGRQTCKNGVWEACTGETKPASSDTSCDRIDNDCDGATDEDYVGVATICGAGACAATGRTSCTNGMIQNSCTPRPPIFEVCDGSLDDDCDGKVDEGCTCTNGRSQSCYTGPSKTRRIGQCVDGQQICIDGAWGTCRGEITPASSDASCDNIDNDCDGQIDGGRIWKHWNPRITGTMTPGLGLRESPVGVTYGIQKVNDTIAFPICPYFTNAVRIPVLMVDWNDFDPSVDMSNPSNPNSIAKNYTPSIPEEMEQWLNGDSGVGQYFYDVSGGQVDLSLDVFGWIRSDTEGSYLGPRSDYLAYSDYYSKWQCAKDDVFLDALRDAVVFQGLDLSEYDADQNDFMDGAVLVYEGDAGVCSGANMSWLNASNMPFSHQLATDLVEPIDPNGDFFDVPDLRLQYYNNIPERGGHGSTRAWAHELGHTLLGYSDYYYEWFDLNGWCLSGGGSEVDGYPLHPCAFEKWLFAHWIEPVTIKESGTYLLDANEIPDGSNYKNGSYLYKIPIGNDPRRFLTIENRWFDMRHAVGNYVIRTDPNPNTRSRWAKEHYKESGLMIVEFNLGIDNFSKNPTQLRRHRPVREIPPRANPDYYNREYSFRPGDTFSQCYEDRCVTITPLDSPGSQVRFEIKITPVPST